MGGRHLIWAFIGAAKNLLLLHRLTESIYLREKMVLEYFRAIVEVEIGRNLGPHFFLPNPIILLISEMEYIIQS